MKVPIIPVIFALISLALSIKLGMEGVPILNNGWIANLILSIVILIEQSTFLKHRDYTLSLMEAGSSLQKKYDDLVKKHKELHKKYKEAV